MLAPRRLTVLLTLAALALAGCVAPPSADDDPSTLAAGAGWAERAVPFGGDHDHWDVAHHENLSTPNFRVLGWDPLVTDATGTTAGGYYCGEAREAPDGRRIAVVNSFQDHVAFVLADVTDPAAPKKIGELVLEHAIAYDVALTPDTRYVIVGADPSPQLPGPNGAEESRGARATFRDACGAEKEVPFLPSVPVLDSPATLLVDVSDPASPVIADAFPAPVLGPHSVSAADVDGRTLVASSTTNLEHRSSYFQFFEVKDNALELTHVYQAPPPANDKQPLINGHVDATIQKHPITNRTLAYLAHWDAGMIVVDITDAVPQQLGSFNDYAGNGGFLVGDETGNLHEAVPIEGLWDGRHYTLVGQEILGHPADHPTGWVWILDTTDPAKVVPVGRWTLPVEVEWETSLQFSTHYVSVIERTMFVALYHGGVWAVDLSTPEHLAAPPSVGAFIPTNVSPNPPATDAGAMAGNPTVLEAYPLPGGDLVVFDAQSGVYVVRFDATMPIDSPPVWPGSEVG